MNGDDEYRTEDMEAYQKRLAEDNKLLLARIAEMGFIEMDYARDMWPPMHTGNFYLCTVAHGYTRTDQSKYVLVPIFRARVPAMHERFVRRKVEEFQTIRPKKYGK